MKKHIGCQKDPNVEMDDSYHFCVMCGEKFQQEQTQEESQSKPQLNLSSNSKPEIISNSSTQSISKVIKESYVSYFFFKKNSRK